MERNDALKIVKQQLTERRYQHTLGVMDTAIDLANRYDVDRKNAELAAIFHDYAKFRPKEEMKQIILSQNMPRNLLEHHHELWHAPVGAYLVRTEVGVDEREVLDAIKYHTSGRENMTMLEKVIYLADYIEPGRQFPGVDEVRELAKENLNMAMIQAFRNTIQFLINKNQPVYPDTFLAYNTLLFEIREDSTE